MGGFSAKGRESNSEVSGWGSKALKKTAFTTPQEAEAAFYEALERADLEAMMEVWSEDEEVSCIHPGGPRLAGFVQVRENWAQLFKSGQRLKVGLSDQVIFSGMTYSVHSLHENILVRSGRGEGAHSVVCLLYTSPSPRDRQKSRMPSSA